MSIMEDTSEGTTSSSASVSKEDTRNTIGDCTIDSDDEPLTSIKIKAEFQCGHCTKSFKVSRQLRAHARTHEQAFKCEHCPKKFPKATLLALHEQKHDVEKLFNCELCSLSFSSTGQLKKHATTMHATATHKGVEKKKESNSVDKKPYKCADCHRIFTTFSLLKTHTFSHTRPFKCDICEKTFTRANHLQAHKFTHQSVKPYKCKLCPKSCCTTSHLKKHMLTHTNPQTFKCEMCFSVFTQGHYLKRHMMRHQQKIDREKKREELKQRGEVDDEDKLCTTLEPRKKNKVDKSTRKPHKCHVCGKAFRTPSVLKRHSYCHTGQRPYQCDYCGKGCTTPGNLVAHKRTHNKDRPILCDICGQDFTDIAQLRKHTKTHPEIQTAPDPPASNPIPVVTRPPQGQQVDVIPGNPGIVAPPGVVAPLIDCSTNHPSVVNVTQLHATPLQPTVIQMPVPQIPTDSKSSVNNLNTLGNFNFIGSLGNPVAAPLGNIPPPPPPPPATHNPTEQDRVTTIWRDCYQQSNYMWGGIPGMDPNYQQNLWGGIPAVPIATVNDSRYQNSIVDCRIPDENNLVNKDHLVDVTAQQFDPRDKAMTQINEVVGSIIMKADGETRLATEYNTMQPLSLNPPLATPISTSMPLTHPTPGIHHTIGHTHQQPLPVEQLSAVTVEQNTSMPQSLIGVTTDANIIHHQTAVPQTLLSTDHGLHPVSGHNSLQTSNQAHLQTAGNPSHLQTTHLNILHTSNQVSSNQASLQSNNLHTVADHSDLQTIEHHVLQPVSQLDITNQMQMGQLVHESTPVLLTGPAPPAAEIITTQIQQLPTTPTIVLTQPSSTVATATLPSSAVLKDEQVGEVLPKLETSEDVVEADEVDSDATDINSDRENPVVKLDEETDSDCSDILEQYTEEQEAMFKFECKVCGKRYPTQGQLMTHGYTHTRPFHCNLCEKSFTRASRLQAHRFLHEVKKALQCKFCPRECKTAAMLKKHMKKHNSLMKKNNIIESDSETDIEQFTESEAEDESENVTEVEKKINPFKCEMCPKRFPRASLLKAHVHTHTRPFKCDQCEKTFSRSGHLRVHRYTHLAVRPHKCKHCPKSFTTASHMRQHALSHTGGVPLDDDQPKMKLHSDGELYPKGTVFKCEMCEKTFQSYQFLKIHTWSHTRPFKCDQCQRDFTRPYHLKAHKFTHSEVKPFTCDYCGKSFCTTSHFKKHMLTHTNPQTFNCNMCSSTFTQEHYLKRHKLRHMDKLKKEKYRSENKKTGKFDDDEKACLSLQPKKKAKESNPQKHRHQCTVCGKGFVTPSVLQRHMYSHTGQRPFVCDFCGKGCSTTGNLAAHKRTHTKDRTFLCDVCGKDYSEMAALRKHARTHLEEKQYQCDMCPQSFVQPFHLKSHKMIHMQMY